MTPSHAQHPTLTVLCGQPDRYSTSFQTRQLVAALEPWLDPLFLRLPPSRSNWRRHATRFQRNYLQPLLTRPKAEYLLYGNDGLADLRHWSAKRILYWYDAPWNWQEQPPSLKQWIHWLRYQNVRHADFVFAVSAIQVAIARALRPGREASVCYLPVGVNCAVFDPATADPQRVRSQFRLPDKPVVGYLGYLGVWNNRFAGEALLDVAPALLEHHDIHFLVVGFGPALPLFRKKAAELGVAGHFTFTGFVDDALVPHCIAAMDICIDTLEEGFHSEARSETKLKQYMAMGRACVATAIGENCVDLDDGRCGVLVGHGKEPLVKGIRSLCEASELRNTLGVRARERAKSHYDWPVLAARLATAVGAREANT